jgi:plastocyanin
MTVAFGAGLNTAQPGNSANHHVVPQIIRIAPGDIVGFVVGGVHVIRAYEDGVRLSDIKVHIPDECEVNPEPGPPPGTFPQHCFFGAMTPVPVIPDFGLDVYYEGLNPFAPPPAMPPPSFTLPSTAINRVESVVFSKPGRFLVICAVLPHFNDAMYALVEVRGDLSSILDEAHDHAAPESSE